MIGCDGAEKISNTVSEIIPQNGGMDTGEYRWISQACFYLTLQQVHGLMAYHSMRVLQVTTVLVLDWPNVRHTIHTDRLYEFGTGPHRLFGALCEE